MGIIKKELLIFKVAAFIGPESLGNHAAVCILSDWFPTRQLQNIAFKIGLAETAFLKKSDDPQTWDIRWFTPEIEMDLCGHATLASAYILFKEAQLGLTELKFNSVSGKLPVAFDNGRIILDFPSREPEKCILPDIILKSIGLKPLETYKSRDYLLIYEDEKTIRRIMPDRALLNQIILIRVVLSSPQKETKPTLCRGILRRRPASLKTR